MRYQQCQNNGQQIIQTYYLPGQVDDLLDLWPLDILDFTTSKYQNLHLSWKINNQNTQQGYLNSNSADFLEIWQIFTQHLQKLLENYQTGELVHPPLYLDNIEDLVYLQVTFRKGGKVYNYLGDRNLSVGDWVIVPVGVDNHQIKARVQAINPRLPFPLPKGIKKVVRKCTSTYF
ncbi:hypothetical protein [Bombilactobacillus bombi]|uniref:hypothetical protein n=1 Tax=Bombilactobacillus bombi TaxID=1303590 RepID=UPI0015E5B6E9|nr:hypothetical protein [Bombilactobacillus bombi]